MKSKGLQITFLRCVKSFVRKKFYHGVRIVTICYVKRKPQFQICAAWLTTPWCTFFVTALLAWSHLTSDSTAGHALILS